MNIVVNFKTKSKEFTLDNLKRLKEMNTYDYQLEMFNLFLNADYDVLKVTKDNIKLCGCKTPSTG